MLRPGLDAVAGLARGLAVLALAYLGLAVGIVTLEWVSAQASGL